MIVAFDPELHSRFVFSAWCQGAGEPFERLHRKLREGAQCAVRVGNNNQPVLVNGRMRILIYGYAVVTAPQTVAWAYTKPALRGQKILRSLLGHLGVDVRKPMQSLVWSPACDGLIRRGWPIVYAPGVVVPRVPDERRAAG